jgi:hypothetical protein
VDERSIQPAMSERPLPEMPDGTALGPQPGTTADPLGDPRALTILTTEHWSLLSARSLVYNEAFARGGMFLTFLSASLVALGLIAAGRGFSPELRLVALIVLTLDLAIGLATLGRLADANGEDMRCLQGMNRIRHAYQEMVPGLTPYFVTSAHDDPAGVLGVYVARSRLDAREGFLHGLTTTPGMIGVIDAALAAIVVGIVVFTATESSVPTIIAAIVAFALAMAASVMIMVRSVRANSRALVARFPTPPREAEVRGPMDPGGSSGATQVT